MSSSDFTTMQNEVRHRLADINARYLNSIPQAVFGGGANNMDILNLDGKTGNAAFNLVGANINNVSVLLKEEKQQSASQGYNIAQSGKYISNSEPVYATGCCIIDMTQPVEQQIAHVKSIALEKGVITYNYVSIWSDGGFRLYNIEDPSSITYLADGRSWITANTYITVEDKPGTYNYILFHSVLSDVLKNSGYQLNLELEIDIADVFAQFIKQPMTEVDCTSILIGRNNTQTITYITALRTLYTILNAQNWSIVVSSYKNNMDISDYSINIPQFDPMSNTIGYINVNTRIPEMLSIIDPQLFKQLLNMDNFNIFIARRIVYMWILMYDFSIAYNFYLQNQSVVNKNLALLCLALLISNNNTFKYTDALNASVADTRDHQLSMFTYELWSIVVQTLVPQTLGNLDIENGVLRINNTSDTCTNINPNIALRNLKNQFDALTVNYNQITPEDFTQIEVSITQAIGTFDGICHNSLNNEIYSDIQNLTTKTTELNNQMSTVVVNAEAANVNAVQMQADVDSTFKSLTADYASINSARQDALAQEAALESRNEQSKQLATQGYVLVQAGKYIVSPNPIYATPCCILDLSQTQTQIVAQINSYALANGITQYNYASTWNDAGFRLYYITDPSKIVYAKDPRSSINTNTFKIQISATTSALQSSIASKAAISSQLSTQGYAVVQKNKIIVNPRPVKQTSAGVIVASETVPQKIARIKALSRGVTFNYISLWDDSGYRLYNITDPSKIQYQDWQGTTTYIVQQTTAPSTKIPPGQAIEPFSSSKIDNFTLQRDEVNLPYAWPTPSFTDQPVYDSTKIGKDIQYTIAMDLYFPSYSKDWLTIFSNSADWPDITGSPRLAMSPDGRLIFSHFSTASCCGFDATASTKEPIQLNKYLRCLMMVKNNTVYLYLNGVLQGTGQPNPYFGNQPLVWPKDGKWTWAACPSWAFPYGAKVKNVEFWDTALSNEQITKYNKQLIEKFNVASANAKLSTQLGNLNTDIAEAQKTLTNDARETAYWTDSTANYARIAAGWPTFVQQNIDTIRADIDLLNNTSVDLEKLQQATTNFYNGTQAYKNTDTIGWRIDVENETLYSVKKSVSENVYTYKQQQDTINNVAPIVKKNKTQLISSQKKLDTRKKQDTELTIYIYIEISILIFIIISSLVIVMTPFKHSEKILYTLLLALVVIVNIFLVQNIFNKSGGIESFVNNNTDVSISPIGIMNAVSEYLVNTENLAILLVSNNVYTNKNQSLQDEIGYYNNTTQQIAIRNSEVQSVFKMHYNTQIKYNTVLQLCNTLSIIIIGFTTLYIAFEALNLGNLAYKILYAITSILVVFASVICLIEVNLRVRSDPKQRYWKKPDTKID